MLLIVGFTKNQPPKPTPMEYQKPIKTSAFSYKRLLKNSRISVVITFFLCSLIVMAFQLTNHMALTILGLLFVCVALIFNSAFLFKIIGTVLNNEIDKKSGIVAIVILLLNVPIAYIYFQIMTITMEHSEFDVLAFL